MHGDILDKVNEKFEMLNDKHKEDALYIIENWIDLDIEEKGEIDG